MKKITAIACILVVCTSGQALSQPLLIEVTGVLNTQQSVDEGNRQTLAPLFGQPYSYTFEYDASLPDRLSVFTGFAAIDHNDPPYRSTFVAGGVSLNSLDGYTIGASLLDPIFSVPAIFSVSSDAPVPVIGLPTPNDLLSLEFRFGGELGSGDIGFLQTGQGSESLPSTPFFLDVPLDDVSTEIVITAGGNGVSFNEILGGSVTSVRVIPEPSSIALGLLGISGLMLLSLRPQRPVRDPGVDVAF